MRISSVNNNNQSSPAFGNLIIKNQKYFAKYGMNIINAISENKDLQRFARESKDNIVFEKPSWAFFDFQDFNVSIKEKGIKGFFYRLFNGNVGHMGGFRFNDWWSEKFVKNLDYDRLNNLLPKAKAKKIEDKQAKLAEKIAAKQAKLEAKQSEIAKKQAEQKEINENLAIIRQLINN